MRENAGQNNSIYGQFLGSDMQNRKMCLNRKIYKNTLSLFCPAWDSFSSGNILFAISSTKWKNVKEKTTKCSLETTEVLLDADRHELI